MTELKHISKDAVPRALELAERYRLLNEPEQAASICEDVLAADPTNHVALRTLLLAVTDQFSHPHGTTVADAERVIGRLTDPYEGLYYRGLVFERWGRAKLHQGSHASMAGDWLNRAMELYEKAETCRPTGNDDAMLRFNACARLLARIPGLRPAEREHAHEFGD